jgi:hypothetical protein
MGCMVAVSRTEDWRKIRSLGPIDSDFALGEALDRANKGEGFGTDELCID